MDSGGGKQLLNVPPYALMAEQLSDRSVRLAEAVAMRCDLLRIAAPCLLFMLTFLHACDFRQMIEDRPVVLPEDSTKPKEQHSAETRPSADSSANAPNR
jgi:hypothetical protein